LGGRGRMTPFEERQDVVQLIKEAAESGARKNMACDVLNIHLRTIQRWEKDVIGDKRNFASTEPINRLTQAERDKVIEISCSERFRDMTPHEIVPILAEEGVYIASESTYYRVLRSEGLLKHRSESKPGSKRHKPEELKATGPDQVWSWDITYLLSNIKGMYYYLYMFEDIWSRAIVGWEVHEEESAKHASSLMGRISNDRNVYGVKLHSDNGSPMKGATMLATLRRLKVLPSFSRPQVSNDNPYSESLFRTLKYNVGYPRSFHSIEEAREWVAGFVDWYNNEHRHSGIKYVTPQQRHNGKDKVILEKRKETYRKAKLKHPERWSRKIRDWSWIEEVYLNPDAQNNSLNRAA